MTALMTALRVLAFCAAFLAVDGAYISLSRGFYEEAARAVSGRGFPGGRLAEAALAYALLLGGFLAFVPALAARPGWGPASAGAAFGAVVYGVFNATNRVLFGGWGVRASLRDTAWGTVLGALAGWAYAALVGVAGTEG